MRDLRPRQKVTLLGVLIVVGWIIVVTILVIGYLLFKALKNQGYL